MKPFMLRVAVSGGLTGLRVGLLNGPDGEPIEFETREEAEAERIAYLRDRNRSDCTYHAWIVEAASLAEWNAQAIADAAIQKAQESSRSRS